MSDREKAVSFADLPDADLHLEALYLGGTTGTINDDPLARLLPIGNQGGFRYAGSPRKRTVRIVVLYTSGAEVDWPDTLDPQTGVFTYYGDNRRPGRELHDTQRSGNVLLRDVFDATHGTPVDRSQVPPFLLFEKAAPGRTVRFRGLLAPGAETLTSDDDLAAIWRSSNGLRFQNYRSRFTVLNEARISRPWLQSILQGAPTTETGCPESWREWVDGRVYNALIAPTTAVVRSKQQQLPSDQIGLDILRAIRNHFLGREHDFEACAVSIWRLIAPATGRCDVTRPSRDGGRDAIGAYLLGPVADRVAIDFALEAKCYSSTTSVGVRDVSRLISRLRHRNFGVFVTLSYFNPQVYDEVRADGHPIAMICGRDVVDALREHGYGDLASAKMWLENQFPEGQQARFKRVPDQPHDRRPLGDTTMSQTPEDFVRALVSLEPELAPELAEHIDDNDGLLPHVFMGDGARWVLRVHAQGAGETRLRRLFEFLDAEYGDGQSETANVIAASFVEFMIDEPDIVEMFGPKLTKSYTELVGGRHKRT